MEIRPFQYADRSAVIDLWQRCNLIMPWNNPVRDIERKLAVAPDLLLVGLLRERLVAAGMAGYDGHRGWVNYLAVEPMLQRQGLGRALMGAIEARLAAGGCPKVNIQVRSRHASALGFYQRLGYDVDEVVSLGKRLTADEPD